MNIYINTDYDFSSIKDKIIRFHVVANSDSPEDQILKLKIRDAIIEDMGPKLKGLTETEKVKLTIARNINVIKDIAEKEVKKFGRNFPITVDIGIHEFPTKAYGNLTFPGGEYQALNIKIGEGGGKNYWCVMFPPLCFTDMTQGVITEKSVEELERVLTEEEINLLRAQDEKGGNIEIKSRIAEVFKDFNVKFAKILGKKTDM